MRKEILFSILISALLLAGVYFVSSGSFIIEGSQRQTYYNVTDMAGNKDSNPEAGPTWWNRLTNYTGNNSLVLTNNRIALYFNFTINNTNTSVTSGNFSGNISNITITINRTTFPNLFELGIGSGNFSNTSGAVFQNNVINVRTIVFFNYTGGLDEMRDDWRRGIFTVNISVNGTGNTNTETLGSISINASNASNGGSAVVSFSIGVDSRKPRITNINVSVGSIVMRVDNVTRQVYVPNSSNITIQATITDANLWNDVRYNLSNINITVLWNATGGLIQNQSSGTTINLTNMTNITSCTFAQGANGCVFQAVLSKHIPGFYEGANISFIIRASDYFHHTANSTTALDGFSAFNITIDNTAQDCEVTVPDGRFIVYRQHTVSCTGDVNETRLYEAESDVEICKDYNSCTGIYEPQSSGVRTLRCETKDNAGNSKACEKEVSVASRATIYSGEAAGPAAEVAPTALDISTELADVGLSTGQSTTFRYGTIDHIITIDSITTDSVTLTVDTISATIGSTQSKEFDLNADGTNDVKITLNRVLLNKADITLEKLAGASVEAPPEEVITEESSLTWLWIVLILIVVAIIVYLVISARKNR